MPKITTPDKTVGSKHYASDYNAMKAAINELFDLIEQGGTGGSVVTDGAQNGYLNVDGAEVEVYTLPGDLATPGANQYYGTNAAGTKGYYALPDGAASLSGLSDVGDTLALNDGYVLTYEAATGLWKAKNVGTGGGGATSLVELSDVADTLTLAGGNVLMYDIANSRWHAAPMDGLPLTGTDYSVVYRNEGGSTDLLTEYISGNNQYYSRVTSAGVSGAFIKSGVITPLGATQEASYVPEIVIDGETVQAVRSKLESQMAGRLAQVNLHAEVGSAYVDTIAYEDGNMGTFTVKVDGIYFNGQKIALTFE